MFKKDMICIVCPRGCKLTVTKEKNIYQVNGNHCNRGIDYGITEVVNPVRLLTSTVKIEGGIYPRLPVVTEKEVPKHLIIDVMKEINKVSVKAPIQSGDVIISNVLSTGVNIIASRSMDLLNQ